MSPQAMLAGQLLNIGGIPDKHHLRQMALGGWLHLVNISGSSLRDIYGDNAVAAFTLKEYRFSDHFSAHPILNSQPEDTPQLFLSEFLPEQQEHFLRAVAFIVQSVKAYRSVSVFCHYGVGRSPAVALAVMRCAWKWPLPIALQIVQQLRPQAHLSLLSVSASSWALSRLK